MYAIFPIVLFFIAAFIMVGLPVASTLQSYFKNRGRRPVVCPDDQQHAEVEVDPKFALRAAMQGKELSRVQTCSHWPANGACGQECLAQVEATPRNLDRLFAKWFKGKSCTLCLRAITSSDWQFGRLGFLNDEFKLIELRQIDMTELGSIQEPKRPLCWTCHQQEQTAPGEAGAHRVRRQREVEGVNTAAACLNCSSLDFAVLNSGMIPVIAGGPTAAV